MTRAGARNNRMNSVVRTTRGFIRQQQSLRVVSLLQQACPLAQVASLQDNATLPAGYDATRSGDETALICACGCPVRGVSCGLNLNRRNCAICNHCGRLFIPWQARPLPRAGAIRLSHSLKQHNTRHTSDHGWPPTPSAARLATPTTPRRTTRSLVRRRAATSPLLQSSSCRPGTGQEAGEEAEMGAQPASALR